MSTSRNTSPPDPDRYVKVAAAIVVLVLALTAGIISAQRGFWPGTTLAGGLEIALFMWLRQEMARRAPSA